MLNFKNLKKSTPNMQVYDTLHEYLASVQKVFNPKLGRLDYISSG